MKLHIYWLDKNWQKRGYAENIHLYIDYNTKQFKKVVTYTNYTSDGSIEAVRKSDILDFIKLLQRDGFTDISN